jgi:hypothetical protein
MKTMPILLLVGVALAMAAHSRSMCSHQAPRSIQPISAQGIARVVIHADAGNLVVHGSGNSIHASGTACADDEKDLERLQLTSRREGDALIIESAASRESWHWFGGSSGWLDTDVTVPSGVAVEIHDGSGDLEVAGTGAVEIDDGSGNIVLKDVSG